MWLSVVLLTAFCVLPTAFCAAEVPQLIHYQGRLTEANQAPLTGAHRVTFRIYNTDTSGTVLWQESHQLTLAQEDRGIFSVLLGSLTPFGALVFNQPLWLSIEVDGEGEMTPRQRFTSVGYAINADTLNGMKSDQFLKHDAVDLAKLATITGGPTSNADALHGHQGVRSVAVTGQPALTGEVSLSAGPNVTVTQSGQTITVSSSGAGVPGSKATASASSTVAISTSSDTMLLSVTVTKSQPTSSLLVLASVQLTHTSAPTTKTVTVKLFRDGTPLDGAYTVRLGTVNQAVSDVPVTVHAWDTPDAGTYTVTLKARASGAGATAAIRRLTVLEVL